MAPASRCGSCAHSLSNLLYPRWFTIISTSTSYASHTNIQLHFIAAARRYPKIFDDADVGPEAKRVFEDAQAMLKSIISEGWLRARGVVGLFPANSVGDDVEVYDVNGCVCVARSIHVDTRESRARTHATRA